VFDAASTKEARYMPWELKEIAFKHIMGLSGLYVWNHLYNLGWISEVAAASFVLNGSYQAFKFLSSTVRLVELHKDGKNVTLKTNFGEQTVKISEIKKERHEKTLVETYEEAYLFPINVNGKTFYLHGNGHESIKNGEVFRAIINGQSIKL